jgi:3-deoxy-7-phosphoheptulonate synthase
MLESNLEPGSQKLGPDPALLKRGISITDACIGWDETEELLTWAYEKAASVVKAAVA